MNSNKKRKAEIRKQRAARAAKALMRMRSEIQKGNLAGTAPCDPELLAPSNSYGRPPFVERGYYIDMLFECCDCQKQELWRADRQKWWYEVAKGHVESTAVRCNACRRKERERKAEARRIHLEGLASKEQSQPRSPAPRQQPESDT